MTYAHGANVLVPPNHCKRVPNDGTLQAIDANSPNIKVDEISILSDEVNAWLHDCGIDYQIMHHFPSLVGLKVADTNHLALIRLRWPKILISE